MLGIRIVIGALEAGFFPASVYLISTWYTRYDIQKRYAIFYLLGCVASAFTGILSYGITFMVRLPFQKGLSPPLTVLEWHSRSNSMALDLHHPRPPHLHHRHNRLVRPSRIPR